jgi:hypothetical protein
VDLTRRGEPYELTGWDHFRRGRATTRRP